MKRYTFVILAASFTVFILGCQKKQTLEEAQIPLSMETLSAINTTTAIPEAKLPEPKLEVIQTVPASGVKLEPLPPAGPYKPTNQEIQTALKNAGYYSGEIDGKIGPKSRRAIEEFQQANGLKADGKVGPKTWDALSRHLDSSSSTGKPAKKR